MVDKVNEIVAGLNDSQRRAVCCTEGPVLIVAGAGSGKTRVLTSRIAYLLAAGSDPAGILALTFTKKAAGEMKNRIAAMVGEYKARKLVMGTFHAVFVRFLREYADSIGYPTRFTIYDTSDSLSAIKACIKELKLDEKLYKPKEVLSRISMAKNNLVTVNAYRNMSEYMNSDIASHRHYLHKIYELYQTKLKQSGVMDFDDILLNMNILLKTNNEALLAISDRFTHIMVDEYQDTNYAQYLILKKLSQFHHNICVVGDDSQSIYAFRGAKIENILKFSKDYPEYKIFRLEQNYRSTQNIVNAANSVIAHNDGRIPKKCFSESDKGEGITLLKTYNEQEEAITIASRIIERMRSEQLQYQDFAILYRTNAQSRVLEEQLRRRNIPYMIYSGNSFFDRMEVKDMMAYFKLCVNPNDDESFRRIVNKPARGIGATTLAALSELALENNTSLIEAARKIPKLGPFCKMIDGLSKQISTTDAYKMALDIAQKSGLLAYYRSDTSIEGLSRTANVEELLNSIAEFVEERQEEAEVLGSSDQIHSLDEYLENTSLLSNVDVSSEEDNSNKVALMTVHSAKGLEFPIVFIAGLEENLFPSSSMLGSMNDIEEERRLFYVALTRACKVAYLSFALSRMRNGKHESNRPSRFIKEIDTQYVANPLDDDDRDNRGAAQEWGGFGSRFTPFASYKKSGLNSGSYSRSAASPSATKTSPTSLSSSPFEASPISELATGQRVEHSHFGKGTLISISGDGIDKKAVVQFDTKGRKTLILRFAKLRIL